MTQPTRELSFKANDKLYDIVIDMDVERDKAIEIARILEQEDIGRNLTNLRHGIITIRVQGTIRPMAMRLIIRVLAQ